MSCLEVNPPVLSTWPTAFLQQWSLDHISHYNNISWSNRQVVRKKNISSIYFRTFTYFRVRSNIVYIWLPSTLPFPFSLPLHPHWFHLFLLIILGGWKVDLWHWSLSTMIFLILPSYPRFTACFIWRFFFFAFQLLHSLFSFIRYEIQAVRNSLLSGETENSTMPWKTTEKIFRWMDEIRRQIGVVYKEDT